MTTYYHEYRLREHLRDLAARDRLFTCCGWFRRNEHGEGRVGWRLRTGHALIRLGCWMQGAGAALAGRTSDKYSSG